MLCFCFSASSWFIDKVVVKETENAISEFVFPYENWLEGSAREITMSGKYSVLLFIML